MATAPVSVLGEGTAAEGAADEGGVKAELPVDEGGEVERQLLQEETAERVGQVAHDKHHQAAPRPGAPARKGRASPPPLVERGVQVLQYDRPHLHQLLLELRLRHLVCTCVEGLRPGSEVVVCLIDVVVVVVKKPGHAYVVDAAKSACTHHSFRSGRTSGTQFALGKMWLCD
jgi:hypothetical protein